MVLVPCSGMVLVQKFWNDPDPLSLVVVYIFLTGPGHLFWNGSGPLFWNGPGPKILE